MFLAVVSPVLFSASAIHTLHQPAGFAASFALLCPFAIEIMSRSAGMASFERNCAYTDAGSADSQYCFCKFCFAFTSLS